MAGLLDHGVEKLVQFLHGLCLIQNIKPHKLSSIYGWAPLRTRNLTSDAAM